MTESAQEDSRQLQETLAENPLQADVGNTCDCYRLCADTLRTLPPSPIQALVARESPDQSGLVLV